MMKIFLNIITSRRLLIILLLILGGISFLGLIIPQKESADYYTAHYQIWLAKALKLLLLNDVYTAWYFISILALLALCVGACLARRLPRVLKALGPAAPAPPTEDLACHREVGAAAAFTDIRARLKRLPFRWHYAGGFLYGRRRPYALLGEVVLHVGVLIILGSALLRFFGHREDVFVFEGNRVAVPPFYGRGLELRADRIDTVADANSGDVLEYRTTAVLLDSGKEAASEDVETNRPLRYRGLGIYQSRMGTAASKGLLLETVKLKKGARAGEYGRALFTWEIGGEGGRLTLAPGESAPLGDTGLQFRYVDYVENFYADDAGISDDGPEYNPVAFVNVVNAGGDVALGFLFKLHPEQSFIRASGPDFDPRAAKFVYAQDEGPWREERREYLFASGSYIAVDGVTMRVTMAAGEGTDLRARSLEGVTVGETSAGRRYKFPFGARVSVDTPGGEYLFRFAGAKAAAVTGFTLTRDPGLGLFYVGVILFAIGAAAAAWLRYDEVFAYVRGGRVCIGARSNRADSVLRTSFERWVGNAKGD
jgi:cytochrome c biogenesis protein ResB